MFLAVHHEYIDEFQNAKGLEKQEKDKPEFVIVSGCGPQRVPFDDCDPQEKEGEESKRTRGEVKE